MCEMGADPVGLDRFGQAEGPLEFAEGAFLDLTVFTRAILFDPFFGADRQQVVFDGHINVFFADTGQFGRDADLVIVLGDVHIGGKGSSQGFARLVKFAKDVLEHPVRLPVKRKEGVGRTQRFDRAGMIIGQGVGGHVISPGLLVG
ncbi:MAG: hypothetical protein ABT10_12675 [Novosphingobium sp. SCN 63-17]|nr:MULTISPECIES: hypothetical protein [unclassified Novosphingobium]MDR6709225.1 hypothetical protein [Novosphingobium sp. 1748]ODU81767.1 MAG: hypothetical protein ABT10_12675 [Novosphingobium sp. SCN 63-17]